MNFEQDIQAILTEIGLTEIQANVYLFVLKSGGATIANIAHSLSINRTNTYNIIEKLKGLNLIWEENRANARRIYAKSYKSILENLTQKESILSQYKNNLNQLAPIFETFANVTDDSAPKIRTYHGIKGLDEIVRDIIDLNTNSSEILLFTNQEDEKDVFSQIKHHDFIKRRIEKGIFIKVLAVNNSYGIDLKSKDAQSMRETRMLPQDFKFNSEIYIYDNKICMIDLKEDIVGVIIESSELYNVHKYLFNMMWNNSKPT